MFELRLWGFWPSFNKLPLYSYHARALPVLCTGLAKIKSVMASQIADSSGVGVLVAV